MIKQSVFNILLTFIFFSCSVDHKGDILEKQGTYECKSKVMTNAPVFRFNSESDSTTVRLGKNKHMRFYDLNSGQFVELYEDSFNYECECINQK